MTSDRMFFSPGDYRLFENGLASNPDYDGERERVHDKLIELHEAVYPEIRRRGLELYPHWMPQWLISASRISPATARVDFMTLRYSKPESIIKLMKSRFIDDFGHFYANAMLAARIDRSGFAIELLVSEKAWVDGQNLKDRLQDGSGERARFCRLLAGLAGEHTLSLTQFAREDGRSLGYQEVLRAKASRLVNVGVLKTTIDKYLPGRHDMRLGIRYRPEDPRLGREVIAHEVVSRFAQLYPIYAFLSWSPENDFRIVKHANKRAARRAR